MRPIRKILVFTLLFALGATLVWKGRNLFNKVPSLQSQEALAESHGDKAPDFPANLEWLNTKAPLTMQDLKGKVVLLDFWTYCCINCMHVIPDLKKLEQKYPNELVVIGVHSAKFINEKDSDNIRQAIERYGLEHPVINDRDMRVWDNYGVNSWPTLILIDPQGNMIGKVSGEGVYDVLDQKIGALVQSFDKKGLIERKPIQLALEKDRMPPTALSFPGKVLADTASQRLFIADSNHNRILVSSLDGQVQDIVGQGDIGMKDGSFSTAQFHHPQGLALVGEKLYVADTENHEIREIDLKNKTVTTIAGNGTQAGYGESGGIGTKAQLNSPWDLVARGDKLLVAMAGSHQIWSVDLKTHESKVFAGTGEEARADGPKELSAFAQPSGLASDGTTLYSADSETSSVRAIDLKDRGEVKSIIARDLFEFGDKDGQGDAVRLQHPLGIAWADGQIYLADTYNNKIKRIDPSKKTSTTFLGDGRAGSQDGSSARLDEPGGLSAAAGKLFIADTNNHQIRVADLKSGQVETLKLQGLEKFKTVEAPREFKGERVSLPSQSIAAGAGKVQLQLKLPEGYKINPDAPSLVSLRLSPEGQVQNFQKPQFPLEVPVAFSAQDTKIEAEWTLYYCAEGKDSLCLFKRVLTEAPLQVSPTTGAHEASLAYEIPLPEKK